jgi:hypothetical protein
MMADTFSKCAAIGTGSPATAKSRRLTSVPDAAEASAHAVHVARRVPDVGVTHVFLDEAHISAPHGQRVTAGVTQGVRVSVLDAGAIGNGP